MRDSPLNNSIFFGSLKNQKIGQPFKYPKIHWATLGTPYSMGPTMGFSDEALIEVLDKVSKLGLVLEAR